MGPQDSVSSGCLESGPPANTAPSASEQLSPHANKIALSHDACSVLKAGTAVKEAFPHCEETENLLVKAFFCFVFFFLIPWRFLNSKTKDQMCLGNALGNLGQLWVLCVCFPN